MPRGTLTSLGDSREVMDRALESERGIEVEFSTHGALVNFRQRCYTLRLLERAHTRKVYPADHPGHGTSSYDTLKLRDCSTKDLEGDGSHLLHITKMEGILPEEVVGVREL